MGDLKMPDINRVSLAGHLTRDPELSYVGNGIALCKLGLAVSRKFKTKEGVAKEETLFINVTAWGAAAEWIAKNKKGYAVYVSGRLNMDTWQDKATGAQRTAISVTADNFGGVQSLTWNNEDGNNSHSLAGGGKPEGQFRNAPKPREIEEPIPDDDIPF